MTEALGWDCDVLPPVLPPPDHKRENHESPYFTFPYCSSADFRRFSARPGAVAQTAKDLVGTWTLVSVTLEQDGKKTDMYGANPQGQAIFDPNGRFSLMYVRSDVPKFASSKREAGTPEENKAAVQGSLAYYGTYSVSETDKVITYHLEGCTFPNWRGVDQKRLFELSGDELTLINPTPSSGSGKAYTVWKRAK